MESRAAGGDVASPSLFAAIERAKKDSMPKENIDRAVAKGKDADSSSLQSVLFEAFGPGGVAILITAVTDNNNRTAPEIKNLFVKAGYQLGALVVNAAAVFFDDAGEVDFGAFVSGKALFAAGALAAPADKVGVLRDAGFNDLGVAVAAKRAFHFPAWFALAIDWKARRERVDFCPHRLDIGRIARIVEHVGN